MKTILIFDTSFPQGHKELNNRLLRILSELPINLLVLNADDYYYVEKPNVKYKSVKRITVLKGTVLSRICSFINFILAKYVLIFCSYDSVLYTTYPNVNFYVERYFFKRSTTITLINHNNIDLLSSSRIRRIYLKYANKVNHIVFASYMKDYLISLGVESNRISELPHPINLENTFTFDKENLILSMGLESNDIFLKRLIDFNNDNNFLSQNNLKLIIRSKNLKLKSSDTIEVIRSYLSQVEYENLYRRSKFVFVFYPESYKYRFSGVIMDSLASGCIVIGNKIPIVEHFSKLYPNNCKCIDSISDIPQLLSQNLCFSSEEYLSFRNDFSNDSIKKSLLILL